MSQAKSKRLSVTLDQLQQAASQEGIAPQQSQRIWDSLSAQTQSSSQPGASQVAWYFGATVMLIALTWLMGQTAISYGNGPTLFLSLLYTAGFTFCGYKLGQQESLRVPAGLLYSLAALMTSVTVYSIEALYAASHDTEKGALIILLATAAVGALYAVRSRIAFVAVPSLLAAAGATVVAAGLYLEGQHTAAALGAYGALVCMGSFMLDRHSEEDFSFWGYVFGAIALFAAFTYADKSELAYALYCAGGLATMVASVLLRRRIFAITGAVAVLVYLGHVSWMFFSDSSAFPLVLTILGGATIYLGVWYRRNAARIENTVWNFVPDGMKQLLPLER